MTSPTLVHPGWRAKVKPPQIARLVPPKCSQRYPLDFALGLIPAIPFADKSLVDLAAGMPYL